MTEAALIEAPVEKLKRLRTLQLQRRVKARHTLERYYADRVSWAHDCIDWPDRQSLAEYQEEILSALDVHDKVSVRSLHGAGKSTTEAVALLHFATTRDALGLDWKCPTTAGAWRQLIRFLWPEVHKWAKLLRWDRLGRDPFRRDELLTLNLNLNYGSAFAVASDTPAYIEGAHADEIFYLFDESKSIIASTFDAAEGAFSGGEGTRAFALSASTPGEPNGRFYDIQVQKPGLEDWHQIHISLQRAVAAGRVSPQWADQRALQWGKNSALYANRVLGEFHSADEDGVIPLSWVEKAVERWKDHEEERQYVPDRLGVDVARMGSDKTILAPIEDWRVIELREHYHDDTMVTAGHVVGVLNAHPGLVPTIDTDGLGSGVTDRVREQGYEVTAFHAGEKSMATDKSGELGFANIKAEAWWHLRELLDPSSGFPLELPDDPELLGDLTAPKWKVLSNGCIQIESKDDLKKRIGRSPDKGDAIVMGFHEPVENDVAYMGSMGADEEDDWDEVPSPPGTGYLVRVK